MEQKPTVDEIRSFYRTEKDAHTAILCKLKKRIHRVGTARLLLIVGMIAALWLCRNHELPALLAVGAAFLLPFLALVAYHAKLHAVQADEKASVRLCENELKALDYDFSAFDGAPEQADTQHPFSLDLDLFGENSLFQSLNRTVTQMGRDRLVDWFKQPLDDRNEILTRQKGILEIGGMHRFRHRFRITGEAASKVGFLFPEDDGRVKKISDSRLFGVMIWAVPAIWILLTVAYLSDLIPLSVPGMYLAASFMLANLPAKQIQKLYVSLNRTENMLRTYSELMEQIEREKFDSVILQSYRQKLHSPDKKPSASLAIKKLSRNIGALDQRFSTMGILLNLLYMRDTRQAIRLERWKREYSPKVKEWLDALGVFDAFCSCGTFAFNHPDYVFPSITDTYCFMEGKGLGHPLLHRDKCVRNDVHIPNGKYFLIVTGANMAGKSTYLRTVGVNFALACTGMPVCAESLAVYPAHLVTSLRTADSLISNESYFFAELKRLKMMIDRLDAGEELFIILDEILKGTNSVDKQKGSIALVKQLIKKNACGIIATHDLLLGTLSDTFPGNVQNRRFEADIRNGELTFTYKIREGIAQNMNATFLMKKMGISGEDE